MNSQVKVAIVTGGGTGIGRCTVHALLMAGYSVVLAGRRKDSLEDYERNLKKLEK